MGQDKGAQQSVRVLIVEPRAAEAAQLCRLLDAYPAAKYLAEVVDHVDRAVAQWREHGADVAMVRLRPGEGLGAQGVVNLCSHAPDLPVIVVADPADEALAVQAVRQGAHDYLSTAQLDTDKLVRSIRYAIEQHQLLTALARSTGKLQASEANLQHIIESNADGVLVVDQQGVVRFINRAVELLLRRSAKELIDQPFSVPVAVGQTQDLTIPGDGQDTRIAELRVVETVWEGGSANLVSLRDITERRRLERLKDEFVAMVSHELRTPLTSVKGAVTLILNKSLGEINDEQADFLQTISSDLDRLTELINNLLDMSKIEAGKILLTRRLVDLAELAEHCRRSHQALLGQRRFVIQSFGDIKVYADANRILQVLVNLLGNAIKFTPADGTITIGLVKRGGAVEVTVEDDGPGISQKDLGRLFQKFEQLEGPTNNRPQGTGLGLAISKEIVELHGGKISVCSDLGHGTSFFFTLPVLDPPAAFTQLFQETKAAATHAKDAFGVLLLDASELRSWTSRGSQPGVDAMLEEWAALIQKNIAAHDRYVVLEPDLLAILAITDRPGLQAIAARLHQVYAEWSRQLIGAEQVAPMRIATALYPEEGTFAMPILQELKEELAAAKQAARSASRVSTEVPHG